MGTIPGVTTPSPCTDLKKLQSTITDMDCLAQVGFQEISAISSLALMALENPDGVRFLENIAYALSAIKQKADDIMGCVSIEAERVGLLYKDPSSERRSQARIASASCL